MRHEPAACLSAGLEAGGEDVVTKGVDVLGEGGAVAAGSAWLVHAAERAPAATRAAAANLDLTVRISALREALSSCCHVDNGNVGAVGNLVPEVARAVSGVLAGVADGLAHDVNSGAV